MSQRRSVAEHQQAVVDLLARNFQSDDGGQATETVPLAEGLGRCIAATVVSPVDLPPFDNSQMDGYAVIAGEYAVGTPLLVAAPIPAGSVPAPLAADGPAQAVPVMTGSMIPPGATAVIPVEEATPPRFPPTYPTADQRPVNSRNQPPGTTADTTPFSVALPAVEEGKFIRRKGSDVRAGDTLVPAGQRLSPAYLGLLAAAGIATVDVQRQPTVLVLATGDEVVQPGTELAPGKIYDANSTLLSSLLRDAGMNVRTSAVVRDQPEQLVATLQRETTAGVDLILTSGGISAGAYEVVKQALADSDVEFLSVAMQPGGPQAIGLVHGVPFLGFPGNPVSSAVSFEVFLRPALALLCGARPSRRSTARIDAALTSPAGRTQFRRGIVEDLSAAGTSVVGSTVREVGGASSHLLASLAAANALILIPHAVTDVSAGTEVEVWLL